MDVKMREWTNGLWISLIHIIMLMFNMHRASGELF